MKAFIERATCRRTRRRYLGPDELPYDWADDEI